MKQRDYYITPKAGSVMRFLWKAAGGDRYILERATYSDQIKYMCLGGIVFATGAMAGLAGGYAFYTIFSPKGSALDEVIHYPTVIFSVLFGIIWGLMIFNIDRFIVTSTGKGDGTEKITSEEFKSAIPRIIMGAIIAITISKPIEIRMFQTEIASELHKKQQDKETEYEKSTRKSFEDRLKDLQSENVEIQSRIDYYLSQIKAKDSLYNIEMTEGNGGRGEGEGPVAKALKIDRARIENELEAFKSMNSYKIADIQARRKKIDNELNYQLSLNKNVSKGLDGLLMRIKLSHEVAGWTITIFITLLFLAIELTPIFFKLMLNKTPYDYLAENRDDLIRAENGIEVRYDFYKDKEGVERHLIINHEAEKMIFEKMKVTEIQKEITEYAIAKYKEREKEKIDQNLDAYIKKLNPDEAAS